VAWRHSEALGFDRRWYGERGLGWVVRAVELRVDQPIALGRTLRTSTAVTGHRRIWARRLAESRFGDGTLAAAVETDWVLLDARGRVVRIPADFGLSFTNPELSTEMLRVAPAEPAADAARISIAVRPADLDPMDHVNNAVYVDWLEEALAAAELSGAVVATPRRLRLEYLASAALGDTVSIAIWGDAGAWHAHIERSGGDVLLRASGSGASPSP
jgi:acyl-ACP thioesterase